MMSDEFPIDDNNNAGTTACLLTRANRCCDSTAKPLAIQPSPGHQRHQESEPIAFTQKKDDASSATAAKTNGQCVEPLKDSNVDFGRKSIAEKVFFEIESSPDELEEISSSSEKENNKTSSDSSGRDQAKSAPIRILRKQTSLRGILKYPPGWRRRAISESSALPAYSVGSVSNDTSFYGTSLDSPDILFELEDDDSCIEDGQDKQKKSVTFSDKMATMFVFRPNSSILGRRLKNQKKAKRRKDKKLKDSLENIPSEQDEIEAAKYFSPAFIDCSSCDSTSDVSSSSGCDCSTSECSGDEDAPAAEVLVDYVDESKGESNKSKRKNRRKRNRKNKQNVRTALEIGGYDSD